MNSLLITPPPSSIVPSAGKINVDLTAEQYLEKLESKLKRMSIGGASQDLEFKKGTANALNSVRIAMVEDSIRVAMVEDAYRFHGEEMADLPFIEPLACGEQGDSESKEDAFDFCDPGPLLKCQSQGSKRERNHDDPKNSDGLSSDEESGSESEIRGDESLAWESPPILTCCEKLYLLPKCTIQ